MKIYLKLLFAMLVWGGTFTSAKLLGSELDPTTSAFLRFLIASSALLILLYFVEGTLPRVSKRQFLLLLGMGLTGVAAYNLFFFYALVHAEAGRGSLITASNPILIALGAAFIFKERFTVIQVLGFLLCVCGVVLIVTKGDFASLFNEGVGKGELAFIGSGFCWAMYTLIGRFISDQLSSLSVITYASCIGTVALFIVALNTGLNGEVLSTLNFNAVIHLLFLSLLATVVCFIWFQEGVKVLGAAKAGVFIYFMPVSAVFWAWLILDERLTLVLASGALMVISGIYLVNKKKSA